MSRSIRARLFALAITLLTAGAALVPTAQASRPPCTPEAQAACQNTCSLGCGGDSICFSECVMNNCPLCLGL